jgi:hypothetical protein
MTKNKPRIQYIKSSVAYSWLEKHVDNVGTYSVEALNFRSCNAIFRDNIAVTELLNTCQQECSTKVIDQ